MRNRIGTAERAATIAALVLFMVLLAGCAGPNPLRNSPDSAGNVAGFFRGYWHGLTIIFSFIGSWFSDSIHIYEVHNNGFWYNLGFVLGLGTLGGGGGAASRD